MTIGIEIIGWAAAATMFTAYVLVAMGRLGARSIVYHGLNVLSGLGIILKDVWNGAQPSVFINVVWAVIGLYEIPGRSVLATGFTGR